MKRKIPWTITTRILVLVLVFAICGASEMAQALVQSPEQEQQAPPSGQLTGGQQPATGQNPPPATAPDAAIPNPAQPPLQPIQPLPEAPSAAQQQNTKPVQNSIQQNQQAPAGAAAAQAGATAGGAGSRPAGSAIAPAKQHQTRSLLIKIGAVGGAAIAIGTVVALTRATGSKPPGAK